MAALASRDELGDMPGVDLADLPVIKVDKALNMATNAVIAEIGWDPRQSVRTHRFSCVAYLSPVILPAMNVSAITVVDAEAVTVGPLDELAWDDTGVIYLDRSIGRTGGIVTYTAGWTAATMPEALKDACLLEAAALIVNPQKLRSWTVDDVTETYAPAYVPGQRQGDPRLGAYRLMAIA